MQLCVMSLERCDTSLFCLIFYLQTFVSFKKPKNTIAMIVMEIFHLQGALLVADWYLFMNTKERFDSELMGCNVDIAVFPLVVTNS